MCGIRKSVLAAILFAVLFVPMAYAGFEDVRAQRAADLLRPILRAEQSIPILGERRMISYQEDAVLETLYRVYSDPPDRRRVVFDEFRRDGKPAEPVHWWGKFSHGGRSKEGETAAKPGFPQRLARMTGGGLPAVGRMFFSKQPLRFHDVDLLARNYAVRVSGEETAAGRAAYVVDIGPRVKGRASYRLWADCGNHFPLRFEVYDGGTKRLFCSVYDRIAYHPVFPEEVFPKGDESFHRTFMKRLGVEKEPVAVRAAAERVGFPVWETGGLPEGSRVEESLVVRARLPVGLFGNETGGEKEVELLHALYTDGIAVALLVEFAPDNPFWTAMRPMLEERRSREAGAGRPAVYRLRQRGGSVFIMERGATVIAVAGNFPEDELLNMVKTLRRVP